MADRTVKVEVLTDGDTRGIDRTAKALDGLARKAEESKSRVRESGDEWEAFRKKLDGVKSSSENFTGEIEDMAGTVGRTFSRLGPEGIAAVTAAGTVLSSALAAGISAGLLGGAGALGITAGIRGALLNTSVQSAVEDFKVFLNDQLMGIGIPFITPLIDSMKVVKDAAAGMNLSSIFEPLADSVYPFTTSLVEAANNALPGFKQAMGSSVPVIDELASELPSLGEAVGDFADSLASAGPGAVQFVHDLATITKAVTVASGEVIEKLSWVYEKLGGMANILPMALGGPVLGPIALAGNKIKDLWDTMRGGDKKVSKTVALDSVAEAAAKAATEVAEATRSVKEYHDALMMANEVALTSEQSQIRMAEAMRNAADSVKQHGQGLDINTAAGLENRQALAGVAQAALDVATANYQSALATGGMEAAVTAADAAINAGRENYIKAAMAMGATRAEAEALAVRMINKPPDWVFTPHMNTAQIYDAVNAVRAAVGSLGGMASTYAQYYYESVNQRAYGGPIIGPGTETSDSVPAMLSTGEHVWTAAEVRAAGGHASVAAMRRGILSGGYQAGSGVATVAASVGSTVTIVLDSKGSRLDDLLVETIRASVDRYGGGSVQAALGRRGVSA